MTIKKAGTTTAAQDKMGKVQQGLWDLLRTGEPRTWTELKATFDPLTSNKNLSRHITLMRPIVRKRGMEILCVIHMRRACYQVVRKVSMED